jgi:hypothetical protein
MLILNPDIRLQILIIFIFWFTQYAYKLLSIQYTPLYTYLLYLHFIKSNSISVV